MPVVSSWYPRVLMPKVMLSPSSSWLSLLAFTANETAVWPGWKVTLLGTPEKSRLLAPPLSSMVDRNTFSASLRSGFQGAFSCTVTRAPAAPSAAVYSVWSK